MRAEVTNQCTLKDARGRYYPTYPANQVEEKIGRVLKAGGFAVKSAQLILHQLEQLFDPNKRFDCMDLQKFEYVAVSERSFESLAMQGLDACRKLRSKVGILLHILILVSL